MTTMKTTKMNKTPGLAQAVNANRVGMGVSSSPPLPPGVGFSSGVPRPGANLNGAAENTGGLESAISSLVKSMSSAGGGLNRGKGSVGPRGPEKPSLARSNAISRRLNGNPSRGTELKGL